MTVADATRQAMLDALNSTLKADAKAVTEVIETRRKCATTMESADVFAVPSYRPAEGLTLGALGLINGIAIALGVARIQAVYNDQGFITRFQ